MVNNYTVSRKGIRVVKVEGNRVEFKDARGIIPTHVMSRKLYSSECGLQYFIYKHVKVYIKSEKVAI